MSKKARNKARQTVSAPPPPETSAAPVEAVQQATFSVPPDVLLRSRARRAGRFAPVGEQLNPWRFPTYAKGVLPPGERKLAMDDASGLYNGAHATSGMWQEGIGFFGYPYLTQLTQRPEYRRASEVIAEEMTRKWLKITAKGDNDLQGKVDAIEEALESFNVQALMREGFEKDGFFGTSFVHPNVGTNDDDVEMRTPLFLRPEKIGVGELKGFKIVEPTWVAPLDYNATDPLSPAFYRPQSWLVMGRQIHASRLLQIVSRPMPDLLKPAYNFGGLSLSQMMKPYVDNWLRTRQSVSDLIQAFTVFVLETDMQALLQNGAQSTILDRAEFFANCRDNMGLMLTDKTRESFKNVSTSLGSLDHLQAQSQEHMCSVSEIPLVKFTGISPSGLNATSDNEIRVFYDMIKGRQERIGSPVMKTIINMIQLHLFGEIDKSIGLEWVELYQLDDAGRASVRKTDADTDAVLIQANVITPDESRDRLRADPTSPYAGLEGEAPPPPEEPPGGGEGGAPTADPAEKIAAQGAEGGHTGANAGDASPFGEAERARIFAYDDAQGSWKEEQHPRGPDGKFVKHGVSKAYLSSLGGKKATGAGLIKHMIMTGKFSEKDILKVAKEDFGITPTNAAKHYFKQLTDNGLDPPPIPATSTAPLTEVEKAIEKAKVEELVSLVSTAIPKPPADNDDCKYISALANAKSLKLKDKIEQIEYVAENVEDSATEDYATQVIQALKGGLSAETAGIEEASPVKYDPQGVPLPDPYDSKQKKFYIFAKENATDLKLIKEVAEEAYKHDAKAMKYAKSVIAALKEDDGGAPVEKPKGELPMPPDPKSTWQASFYKAAKENNIAQLQKGAAGHYISDPKIQAYAKQLLDHLGVKSDLPPINEPPKPAPKTPINEPPKPAPKTPIKHTAAAQEMKKSIVDNIDKIQNATNKANVKSLVDAVENANLDTSLLAAIKPVIPASGASMAVQAANEWLSKVQIDNGITPTAAPAPAPSKPSSSSYAPSTPVQKAVFEKAKGAPPYKSHQIHEMEDVYGNTVEAALKINTKEIADEGFAKVSSAYGDDPTNGATQAVSAAMGDYTNEVMKILTPAEKKAAHAYKGSAYQAITALLLGKSKGGPGVEKTIKDLESAINKAKVPCDTPSYRGLNASLKDLTGFDNPAQGIGRCFVHKNFGSTSRNVDVSKNFGDKVLLKFTLPAGAPGLPGLPWSGENVSHSHEEEIMINRNSVFRIDKIEQNPHGGGAKHLVHVTYLGIKQND